MAEIPTWLRATDVILGIISIIAAILVLIFQTLAIQTLIIIIAIGLFLLGLARLLRGIFSKILSDPVRALNVAAGLIVLIAAAVTLLLPGLAVQLLIWILAFSLLIIGVMRLVIGGFTKEFPTWLRGLLIIIGIVTIIFSIAVFIFPTLGEFTLVILLSLALLSSGIGRIGKAVAGSR
ncbi:MAG: DUF308 domain-containing protein [Promethearchaeota archaeon]